MASPDFERNLRTRIERELARLRVDSANELARKRLQILGAMLDNIIDKRGFWKHRRRGDGSMPALVEPPRGPKPFTGGAAAPLEFD
jgi:hypothetical protein